MKHLLFLPFFFLSCLCYAQVRIQGLNELSSLPLIAPIDTLDNADLHVHYQFSFVKDVRFPTKYTNYSLILQIGPKLSRFSDYNSFFNDSIIVSQELQGVERNKILMGMMSRRNLPYSEEIFKNLSKDNYTVFDKIILDYFYYEEAVPPMEWTITAMEDTTLMGYTCGRATCHFRGRDYTAWFAPDIAIDNGPWKFHGLPGLILQVEEANREFIYRCTAFYRPRGAAPIYKKQNDYVKTTRKKWLNAKERAEKNPSKAMEGIGQVVSRGNASPTAALKERPYNPIELE
ncbi:MAG: GLPGLI family protein [Mediterranea sp.]|jgi:GLPGLI family protein|nr:GLPGLI family protein [Mediterranea sp.]